jgi:hypothetical protein
MFSDKRIQESNHRVSLLMVRHACSYQRNSIKSGGLMPKRLNPA